MTANAFGVYQCTVSKILLEVCQAINQIVRPRYLHLPQNKDKMREIVSTFEAKFGVSQVFGCIDGTHILIKRPVLNS